MVATHVRTSLLLVVLPLVLLVLCSLISFRFRCKGTPAKWHREIRCCFSLAAKVKAQHQFVALIQTLLSGLPDDTKIRSKFRTMSCPNMIFGV